MIAQWENKYISLSVLPVARVQFLVTAEYFKGIFPWLITCVALYTDPRRPKGRTTAETVVKSEVVPTYKMPSVS